MDVLSILNRIKLIFSSYRLSNINIAETMSHPVPALILAFINAVLMTLWPRIGILKMLLIEGSIILLFAIIHSIIETSKTISSTIRYRAIKSIKKLF